ncbi:unnamed protein product [Diatraea saccharalis]|uniref:Uncharacterized protein n=1 Tax=Diatraea saccharalis TaxID=40085 RepID=A0A9N9QWF6_9NEOP|nr:unnamed protein product [Diatraea saccharalis]
MKRMKCTPTKRNSECSSGTRQHSESAPNIAAKCELSAIENINQPYETTIPDDPPRAPCSIDNRHEQQIRSDDCEMAMRVWAPCTVDEFYGYNMGTPCVFLRLNYIQRPAQTFGDYVWVSCGGEMNSDKENIGPIQFIPAGLPPGFPVSRLHTADKIPYANRNLPDQTPPPLIAVFFENPRREVLINVECRIWTRDIYYDPSSRVGRARFELFINH